MESFLLLDHYHTDSGRECDGKNDEADYESCNAVTENKSEDGTSGCSCSPIDVSSLDTHEFKGLLQPLEYRICNIVGIFSIFCHRLTTESKEQRKGLSCCNEEDTGSDNHHDLLLDILFLIVHSDIMAML